VPDIAPRRWLYLFLVLASTVAAVTQMAGVLQLDGYTVREVVILSLFAILFAWIASSFWLSVFGFWARLNKVELLPLKQPLGPSAARTAILMPVYNEDVARVFSGVRAIWESAGSDFDFFILSDSTNPANWVAEELEWQRLKSELGESASIFYRHRAKNTGRKSGNIQDFCENWGQLYDYMVILDADRFGVSQLHQLRGRVGRGADESYCILLGDVSPEVAERLHIFVRTEDGFEIAREDLRLRGMGDLFGERQSGVPTFRVADPLRDEVLNESARAAAERLLVGDPDLTRSEHAALRRVLGDRYAKSLELFRVG